MHWSRTQFSRCYSWCSEMLMLLAPNNAVKCQTGAKIIHLKNEKQERIQLTTQIAL